MEDRAIACPQRDHTLLVYNKTLHERTMGGRGGKGGKGGCGQTEKEVSWQWGRNGLRMNWITSANWGFAGGVTSQRMLNPLDGGKGTKS